MTKEELIKAYEQEIKILTGILTAYEYSSLILADITFYQKRFDTLNEELRKIKENKGDKNE